MFGAGVGDSKLNKFKHVQGRGRGPCTVRSRGVGVWSLYGEFQCIMGNDHMGPPEQNDRHDSKHYLPAISLTADRYGI